MSENVVTAILVGMTGSGKSLLGNRLLQLQENDTNRIYFDVSEYRNSPLKTVVPQKERLYIPEFDYTLQLVDTPGMYKTYDAFGDKWMEILQAVAIAKAPINAFIVVISLEESSFSQCVKVLEYMKENFPGEGRKVLVVFTHLRGRTEEEEIRRFERESGSNWVGVTYEFSDQTLDGFDRHNAYRRIKHYLAGTLLDVPFTSAQFQRYCKTKMESALMGRNVKTFGDIKKLDYFDCDLLSLYLKEEDIKELLVRVNGGRCILL